MLPRLTLGSPTIVRQTRPRMCGPPPRWRDLQIAWQTLPNRRDAMEALDPEPLLRFLHEQGVDHILIGGVAVAAHGYRRPSQDLDIVPDPSPANLTRLTHALRALNARPADLGDFDLDELPADSTRVEDLALGGNFRLETDLGALDIMQWVSGMSAIDLYRELDGQALSFRLDEITVRYCSLQHLRAMKTAAGRPRDLDDLQHLPEQ